MSSVWKIQKNNYKFVPTIMTNKDFAELMQKTFDSCIAISKAKGNDYTKGSLDALANFKAAGEDVNVDALHVCWIFMNKHYAAITNYVKTGGQSESEPIAERIKDCINYLVLLQGLIIENESYDIEALKIEPKSK